MILYPYVSKSVCVCSTVCLQLINVCVKVFQTTIDRVLLSLSLSVCITVSFRAQVSTSSVSSRVPVCMDVCVCVCACCCARSGNCCNVIDIFLKIGLSLSYYKIVQRKQELVH